MRYLLIISTLISLSSAALVASAETARFACAAQNKNYEASFQVLDSSHAELKLTAPDKTQYLCKGQPRLKDHSNSVRSLYQIQMKLYQACSPKLPYSIGQALADSAELTYDLRNSQAELHWLAYEAASPCQIKTDQIHSLFGDRTIQSVKSKKTK